MNLPIKLKLPYGFLDEEVRSGYTVTTSVKKVWAIELDLLEEFFRVCKKNGIRAFAAYGTLLGAVRHKGFIPWDDDADVYMDRRNFKKLLKLGNEFDYPYFLQTAYSDRKYFCPYARLRNSLTTGVITGQESPDYNNGIYIDIFVLDGYPKPRLAAFLQRKVVDAIGVLFFQGYTVKRFYKLLSRIAKGCFPYRLAISFHVLAISFFEHYSSKVSLLTHSNEIEENITNRSDLEKSVEFPFENITLPVPLAYDKILIRLFGDYMKFPPVEERGKWHEGQIYFNPDMPYKEYFKQKDASIQAS